MNTVLVVDDESSVRQALRKLLERGGMVVREVGTAQEALDLVAGGEGISVVVSDVLMPEMNGLAFYDQLVALAPTLRQRVIFLTGAAHQPEVHGPIEERGVPLLSKVDDLMLVVDAVRVALLRR